MSRIDRSLAEAARAWPFEEARKLVARIGGKAPAKGYVLLETGYGPSGLPHIGTFGEVARTTMVQHAFRVLTRDKIPTRLIAFSDDMDGLRKVPDNIPNKDALTSNLHKPLTAIPDPFGCHESFAHHNNAKLREFLDGFGFMDLFARYRDSVERYEIALVTDRHGRVPVFFASRWQRREFLMGWLIDFQDWLMVRLGLLQDVQSRAEEVRGLLESRLYKIVP